MTLDEFRAAVTGRLIVSCQAGIGHPLRDTGVLTVMARAAVAGGAAAIRCGGVGGLPDVAAVASAVTVPVVGLTKEGTTGVYITPTVRAAVAVVAAGAAVVAADATNRPRPDGSRFADAVRAVHDAGALMMADVSNRDEGLEAAEAGADMVATTLAGYVGGPVPAGPDLELVRSLRATLPGVVVVAEGRYHHPEAAAEAIRAGATSVVVGTAITDPMWITTSFATAIEASRQRATERATIPSDPTS